MLRKLCELCGFSLRGSHIDCSSALLALPLSYWCYTYACYSVLYDGPCLPLVVVAVHERVLSEGGIQDNRN